MFSRQIKSFQTIRTLFLAMPLFLTACHSDFGPFPMPSGYHHHDKLYKAPPGPEPILKKIEHMRVPQSIDKETDAPEMAHYKAPPVDPVVPVMQPEIVYSAWDDAARELVLRLSNSFGTPVEAVFISPPDAMSSTEMKLEKALRRAMGESGYNIAPAPGMGPYKLHYAARPLGMGDGTRVMVTITLTDHMNETVAEESGIYGIGEPAVMRPVPAPHEHSGPAMSGEPIPLLSPAP